MNNTLLIANIVVSVLIVVFILLQGRGAGLGSAWGGGGETFQTRRGVEKVVMRFTALLIFIFLAISIASIIMRK
ncbi:MAG: preprotein translocase subunit SecG [bacterium]